MLTQAFTHPTPPAALYPTHSYCQLEQVGASGFLFVLVLAGVIIYYSVVDGLPAIASGELPLWRPALPAELPEAVGVLSFA